MSVLSRYCYLLAALAVFLHTVYRDKFGLGLTIGIVVVATAAGGILSWCSRRWSQRRRDRKADRLLQKIVDAARPGRHPDYVLFLRPFSTTGRLTVANPSRRWLPLLPRYFSHQNTLEFETLLSEAIAPGMALIALGRPGEHIGAGRIAISDENWKEAFQLLVQHASWIVLIPNDQGETRWEVEWLASNGYFSKVVMLMPPKLKSSEIDIDSYWGQVCQGLKAAGLELPTYTPAGQFFRMRESGRFFRSRYLAKMTTSRIGTTFIKVTQPSS